MSNVRKGVKHTFYRQQMNQYTHFFGWSVISPMKLSFVKLMSEMVSEIHVMLGNENKGPITFYQVV